MILMTFSGDQPPLLILILIFATFANTVQPPGDYLVCALSGIWTFAERFISQCFWSPCEKVAINFLNALQLGQLVVFVVA